MTYFLNESININLQRNYLLSLKIPLSKNFDEQRGWGADVPLFETIKTKAGTQPKNELQQ